jgi:isorenieratene synthase
MSRFFPERVETGQGRLERVPGPFSAVVVGGGLAGMSAATVLAERGASVTVVEREPYLGGRAGAWTDQLPDGEPFEMERGFHAFFRQYYNVRTLLRRFDPRLEHLTPLTDYPLLGPGGAAESFTGLPRHAPLNVIELVRRTPRLRLLDLARVNVRAALAMLTYDEDRTFEAYDPLTARDYLDSLNFPTDARQMLFNVFAHSFFNPEERMSAGDLLMMFHFYFLGNPEGLVFDVLDEPFSKSLWQPWRTYLEGRQVRFLLGCAAQRVKRRPEDGWHVEVGGEEARLGADAVVIALDVPALQKLVSASPDLGDPAWRAAVNRLEVTYPFVVWRGWLDRPVQPGRHPFVGTAGMGEIDNISVYELFEGESRRWAQRTGGSVVELHAYAVSPDREAHQVRESLVAALHEVYPETRSARILDERLLWRQDCPAFPPGSHAARPGVVTPARMVVLAGDFVRLPFPCALMERAVASGFAAANHLLDRYQVRPQEIWSVPRQGLLAGLPRLAWAVKRESS